MLLTIDIFFQCFCFEFATSNVKSLRENSSKKEQNVNYFLLKLKVVSQGREQEEQ